MGISGGEISFENWEPVTENVTFREVQKGAISTILYLNIF